MNDSLKKIKRATLPYPFEAYSYIVSPLSEDDGGGFLITIPDLPGFMSDGETIEEAIENGRDAFQATISALTDMGREIPKPSFRAGDVNLPNASGKFITRVPKSLHAQLTLRAKQEGVSLNTLVLSFLASGMSRREEELPDKSGVNF